MSASVAAMTESGGDVDKDFAIECSDDDNYDNNSAVNTREVNGRREWEPNGADIRRLYSHLSARGVLELRWQCPGRRSPSVHGLALHGKPDATADPIAAQTDAKTAAKNEFDFESDFNGDDHQMPKTVGSAKGVSAPHKRRSTAGLKKSQTNLTFQYWRSNPTTLATTLATPTAPAPPTPPTTDTEPSVTVSQSIPTTITDMESMSSQVRLVASNTSTTSTGVRSDSPTDIL
ncbi:unnamed protein product [Oppiella nova]|uniref:Uncharacterized protein n=1 Tax=Oppiella nova TaxID=334625 RepID=A0A7R9QPY0_9ACAR|nr:unnamed protein product [Oppiella nova]CAG2170667.1 unnamed protein product [Oppiella nova]